MTLPSDKAMVNQKKETVNFSMAETVYGFTQESLVMRKTCNFEVFISERDGDLHMEMKAKPL